MSGQIEWMAGWSRGCTPPYECCRLPPTYFWTTWHQTRAFLISMKSKKVIFWPVWQFWKCAWVILNACGFDPVVALHLRNAADYRLSTFGSHGTKLGHSWFQWKMKSDSSCWFDNSEKWDIPGHSEWMGGRSRGCTPLHEWCRLLPTYFWTTWHQTRAFLISVNKKKWFFWLVWQFWKNRRVWAVVALAGVIPRLHSALGMLQTTAYLHLDHMAPNKGILDCNGKWKVISDWFDSSEKGDVSVNFERLQGWSRGYTLPQECCRLPPTYFWVILNACGFDPVVALHLRNAADYRLSSFGSHGTKLGHSWFQWKMKSDSSCWFYNSEKWDIPGHSEWMGGCSRGCTPLHEWCRLLPTYFWTTWHQTRAFLISVNNKSDLSGWFDISKEGEVFGHCRWMLGWSSGCTLP